MIRYLNPSGRIPETSSILGGIILYNHTIANQKYGLFYAYR